MGRRPPSFFSFPPATLFQAPCPASLSSNELKTQSWNQSDTPHPFIPFHMPMRTKSKNRMQILGAMSNICFPTSLLSRALSQDRVIPMEWIGLSRPAHLLSLPFSGFSSLFREGWLPGMTEMTSRLFPLLFF